MILPLPSVQVIATLCAVLGLGSVVSAAPTADQGSSCLPVVDLGYELHRALWYNEETDIYKFQNIRYAEEPTGDLRFRAPVQPQTNRTVVNTGSETKICPQGRPIWQAKTLGAIAKYSNPTVPFTLEAWKNDILNGTVPPGDMNANATEDCLLLDVHVPKNVFTKAAAGISDAPVLVWIHGGGAVFGSKDGSGPTVFEPSGILAQARKTYGEEFVFVGLNYRLGALGFSAGPEVESDGTLNAGLLDQRFALEWVQDNIHLFGGSKDRVTAMGESGGAGSILLHTVVNDRTGPALFQQVIAQSPAGVYETNQEEVKFNELLSILNVQSLEEARGLDSQTIIQGNAEQIAAAPSTSYPYGPVIDGEFVTETLQSSLKNGRLDESVKILVSHNVFEGGFFFDPNVETDEEFGEWLLRSFPALGEERKNYMMESLYPSVYDGSLGYVDQSSRGMAVWGEAVVDCSFQLLAQSRGRDSYAYEFGVSPGMHIQDLQYTFAKERPPAPIRGAQDHMQLAIASFVLKGVPLLEPGLEFPLIGDQATAIVNITSNGTATIVPSKVNQTRCDWWAEF